MTCPRCDRPAVWTVVPVEPHEDPSCWEAYGNRSIVWSCHDHLPDTLNTLNWFEADFLVRSINGTGWKE